MDSPEGEIQQAAKRKMKHIRVSARIRSQSQLYWHRPSETSEVHPCRTCEPDEALGLPDIPETWNEKRKVLVQYIVYPNIGDMRLVSRNELIPYHGLSSSNKKRKVQRANGTKVGGGGGNWCENLMERYRKQRAKQLGNGSIGSGGSGGGGKRKGRGKKGKPAPMNRNDIQVDVLVQTLYLEKVLESVRTQEVGSKQSSDSGSEHSIPDSSMGSASGGNWGSKITKKGSEDEQEEISWSQEFKSRVKPGQQKQTTGRKRDKSTYNTSTGSVSSSEDSSDDDVEALLQGDKKSISSNKGEKKKSNKRSNAMSSSDEDETEPTSFSQERDSRMKTRKGTVSAKATTARSKARELESDSDSSSSNSDSDRRLQSKKKKAGIHPATFFESNESISVSSDSDNESEGDTSVTGEALQKKRNTDRSSKGRVSFGGISVHDDGDGENDADGSDDEGDDEHELLDIPYTQALGLESDDDYLPPPMLDPENAKSKEPIRPGDVIEYSSFLFVAGDKRGHREATVISVDPNREPVLVLDNGEVLPSDSTIRRTKVLLGGKLRAHSGVSRPIQNFVLEKAVMEGRSDKISAGFAKEANRVGGIIRRNMTKFQEKAQAEGFAPMDMMNRYKGTNFDSNIGYAATSNKEKKKKKVGLSPIKERWGRSHSGDTPSTGRSSRKKKKKSTHQSSQSSALSESSRSDSEEEQPRRSSANSKTKRSSSNQGKKKRTAPSPVLDLSRSSSDDDDDDDGSFDSESPRPRATSTHNHTSSGRRKDAVSSGSLSSFDSEDSDRDIGGTTKASNKRKSLDTKKTPKRDVWDTSPRKHTNKKSSATKKDKKRDSLSFDSSDDDFEAKGKRRIITVSDKKKKKPNQHSSNSSSKKKAKTKKTPSPSSPVIDLSSSDEKPKQGGWLQSLGGGTKKSKTSHLSGRRKNTKDEGGAASTSFSLRRFK